MESTVVITGGTRGIGRAVATAFAEAGAQVVICGREAERVEQAVDELNADHERVSGLAVDVRDESELRRLFEHAAERGGSVDVVIANAAINHGEPGEMPLDDESYEQFDETMATNVRGVFSTLKEAVPHLARDGRMLVPSGSVARKAKEGMGAYAVSKAAAEAIARGFSVDIDQPVCVVDPGLVATDLTGIHKARDADDIAPMYLWVATEADADDIDGELVDLRTWKQSTR